MGMACLFRSISAQTKALLRKLRGSGQPDIPAKRGSDSHIRMSYKSWNAFNLSNCSGIYVIFHSEISALPLLRYSLHNNLK